MARLSIQDMAKAVADKHGLSKADAEAFVSTFFDTINEGLNLDKAVKVKGLGTFKVIDVKGRESVNVNTGERVMIEGHGKITFTPDTIMRDLVNKPFAQFETVVINDGVDIDALNAIGDNESIEDEDETPQESNMTDEKEASPVTEIAAEEPIIEQKEDKTTSEAAPQETPEQEQVADKVAPIQEPLVEEIAENTAEEEPESNDEPTETIELQAEEEMPEEPQRHRSFAKPLLLTLLIVLIAAAALVAGYYWGHGASKPVAKQATPHPTATPAKQAVKADTTTAKDTATIKPQEPAIKPDPADEPEKIEPKQAVKTNEKKATEPSPSDNLAMRNAKAFVRTGAYRIVGTTKTLTVKKGESMKKLAKRYLGESMECYIQVHNGVAEVTEGMTLNIPKLELKKKRSGK